MGFVFGSGDGFEIGFLSCLILLLFFVVFVYFLLLCFFFFFCILFCLMLHFLGFFFCCLDFLFFLHILNLSSLLDLFLISYLFDASFFCLLLLSFIALVVCGSLLVAGK